LICGAESLRIELGDELLCSGAASQPCDVVVEAHLLAAPSDVGGV
jgi:hypothetical protein